MGKGHGQQEHGRFSGIFIQRPGNSHQHHRCRSRWRLASNPTVTYLGAKDTMTQDWAVSGFTASAVIKAGSVVEVTGRYYVSRASRQAVLDASGAQVKFRAVVTADVTLSTAGAGTITVSAPVSMRQLAPTTPLPPHWHQVML